MILGGATQEVPDGSEEDSWMLWRSVRFRVEGLGLRI